MKPCPWCEAPGSYEHDGDGRLIVWACYSYKTETGEPAQSIEEDAQEAKETECLCRTS